MLRRRRAAAAAAATPQSPSRDTSTWMNGMRPQGMFGGRRMQPLFRDPSPTAAPPAPGDDPHAEVALGNITSTDSGGAVSECGSPTTQAPLRTGVHSSSV